MAQKPRTNPPTLAAGLIVLMILLGCGSNGSTLGEGGGGGSAAVGGSAGSAGLAGAGGAAGFGGTSGLGGAAGAPMREVIELDPTFGDDGIRIFSLLDSSWTSEGARAVTVMPDDRIVLAGTKHLSSFGSSYGFVVLLGDDGELQTSFGEFGDGHAVAAFDANTELSAVVVDSVGRIVVGGWSKSFPSTDPGALAVARYLDDGTLDASFGDQLSLPGVTQLSEPCTVAVSDVALQADGRIVVTGSACESPQRLSAARFLSDGTPDPGFGDNGMLLLDSGYGDEVLISSDELGAPRIMVGGSAGDTGFDGNMDFAVAALSDDGSLDPTFGEGGVVVTDFGDGSPGRSEGLAALAHRPDGGLLAAGWAQTMPNFSEPWTFAYDFLVAAYDGAGALDESFGDGGFALVDFGDDTEEAVEVLRRESGNIVVVGQSRPRASERAIAIAHLRFDGTPVDGTHKTLTELEGVGLTARGATLDNYGRLLVAGYVVYEAGGVDIFVARYLFPTAR